MRDPARRLQRYALIGLAAGTVVAACATNPATGKRQVNFYSEASEIQMGREADQQISAQLGLVDDPAIQKYVSDIGMRLAAKSERPNLPWSFKVVDDPAVNAFALPGGFIYVTRGILAHMGSEAELAGVVGHEIGHVTAQHGVNQLSKQQLAMGGLMVGMILSPELANAGNLAQTGLGLLFLKYGRDDERQADDLGLRYVTSTGYEPREMPKMFDTLRRVGESVSPGGRVPNWLSTHPEPQARAERTAGLIEERQYPKGEVGADRYLPRIDGLEFGADPREGYFERGVFYHPELAFRIDFPSGWRTANEKARVAALHPDQIAQVELGLAAERSPEEAAAAFARLEGVSTSGAQRVRLQGLTGIAADFSVPRQQGDALVGRAVFVELDGRVFRLLGLAVESRAGAVRNEVANFLGSFARLTDRSKIDVRAQRLELVTLRSASSFDEFLSRYPSEAPAETVALINGIEDRRAVLPAGTKLKRIVGERVGDPPRAQ
jgi:predicted Zn-dependent protease